MPYTARHDQGFPGRKADASRRFLVFEHDGDTPGEQEEEFVAVGVHFARVGWFSDHERGPDGEPVDSRGRSGPALDLMCLAVAIEPDDRVCEIERATRLLRHDISEFWCRLTDGRSAVRWHRPRTVAEAPISMPEGYQGRLKHAVPRQLQRWAARHRSLRSAGMRRVLDLGNHLVDRKHLGE